MADEITGGIADASPTAGIADNTPEPAPAQGDTTPAPDNGTAQATPQPAANDWTIEIPEDFAVPEDNFKSFVSNAKSLGLSKEQTAGMLNWHKQFDGDVRKSFEQQQKQAFDAWNKEIQSDTEFGGRNWNTTLANAKKCFDTFDTDGSLRNILIKSGYQHNPSVIRAIARIGAAMGEHGYIAANGEGGVKAQVPLEDRLYPNMKMGE